MRHSEQPRFLPRDAGYNLWPRTTRRKRLRNSPSVVEATCITGWGPDDYDLQLGHPSPRDINAGSGVAPCVVVFRRFLRIVILLRCVNKDF